MFKTLFSIMCFMFAFNSYSNPVTREVDVNPTDIMSAETDQVNLPEHSGHNHYHKKDEKHHTESVTGSTTNYDDEEVVTGKEMKPETCSGLSSDMKEEPYETN